MQRSWQLSVLLPELVSMDTMFQGPAEHLVLTLLIGHNWTKKRTLTEKHLFLLPCLDFALLASSSDYNQQGYTQEAVFANSPSTRCLNFLFGILSFFPFLDTDISLMFEFNAKYCTKP